MATAKKAKKVSRASLMRQYYNGNPEATPKDVAKRFKTTYQVAYMVKRSMQPKKLILTATELAVANKLGITSKVYAEHKARAGKFKTVAVLSSDKSITDTIRSLGGPTDEEMMNAPPKTDPVNHPAHYKIGGIETIDFIEAKGLGYHIGNVVKYITRAGHKGTTNGLEDLKKAQWYLNRAIEKNENPTN
jgi:hypothetical protein